jgi:hypothetical protein
MSASLVEEMGIVVECISRGQYRILTARGIQKWHTSIFFVPGELVEVTVYPQSKWIASVDKIK